MPLSRRAAIGVGIAGTALALAQTSVAAQAKALPVPSTPLADKATELINGCLDVALRNHSLRGYHFGLAVGERHGLRPGVDYNAETMYLICVLHDLGLARDAGGNQRFEVDGADAAVRFLEENGVTDARADTIWDAIAAHTTGFLESPVWRRRRPPETWIAVEGIGIDVAGAPTDLPPGYADLVHSAYPRLGGSQSLTAAIENQALVNPEKAPPGSLAREIIRAHHPEIPQMTWDDILATSQWAD
ncbi:metal dependent phosphohydrolase [Nocardia tenerifensis]|uniref:Metal dependent phosphohydrolase n=1 Tax=Nocardia tenerifensis TaxID=228006 RepID=A0A318JXY9_9NOCA|nr:HD domain-containing protein [Nocardia tenerifensis]PXX58716.1 metal dependent phosphohydrolase [Nocardia tenerifensis]